MQLKHSAIVPDSVVLYAKERMVSRHAPPSLRHAECSKASQVQPEIHYRPGTCRSNMPPCKHRRPCSLAANALRHTSLHWAPTLP